MRAKFVFEKFTQDGDPISDMAIGMMREIKKWFEDLKRKDDIWSLPNFSNSNGLLRDLISTYAPKKFIEYVLQRDSDYDKDYVLRLFLQNKISLDLVDYVIKKGGKFEDLSFKIQYIKIGGKLSSLTPEEELTAASRFGNFDDFKKLVNAGVPLKIGMINSVFKKEWSYKTEAKREYEKIRKFLIDNIDRLEDIVHPRDSKKLDRIKSILLTKKSGNARSYPQGYRIYRILKFVNENKPDTRQKIVKFIFELNYGKDSFNPLLHGSYYSDGFRNMICPYLHGDIFGFKLNNDGKQRLEHYEKKFSGKKIDAYI